MKYIKPIFLFILYEISLLVIFNALGTYFPDMYDYTLSPFIPSDNIVYEELILCNFLIPLSGLGGFLVGGYVLAPIILYLHKKFFGTNLTYGIQQKEKVRDISVFHKAFFPVMLAINIASTILISSEGLVSDLILAPVLGTFESTSSGQALRKALTLLLLFPIAFSISMFVFSSVWFLKNSGIVYSNEKEVESLSEPWVIRSVGGWFHTILKGYAGVGVIINFTTFLIASITSIVVSVGDVVLWLTVILWFVGIFLLLLAAVPSLILNELIRKKSANFVQKYAYKLGINHIVEMRYNLGGKIDIEGSKKDKSKKSKRDESSEEGVVNLDINHEQEHLESD